MIKKINNGKVVVENLLRDNPDELTK